MPLQIFEQALMKEIKHINELIRKEIISEISIEDKAKNELLEIKKTLQKQIEKSKRYSVNMQSEGDFTREEMVRAMEIMREVICKIEISSIKKIIDGTIVRYIETPKIKIFSRQKVSRVLKQYTEE